MMIIVKNEKKTRATVNCHQKCCLIPLNYNYVMFGGLVIFGTSAM